MVSHWRSLAQRTIQEALKKARAEGAIALWIFAQKIGESPDITRCSACRGIGKKEGASCPNCKGRGLRYYFAKGISGIN